MQARSDFLEKPIDAERLLDKLEKAIKQKTLVDAENQREQLESQSCRIG